MVSMREHVVQWVTAAPLWRSKASDPTAMKRPALLRFQSDSFMDDFAGALAATPIDLSGFTATPMRFGPAPVGEDPTAWPTPPAGTPLKLFQPVHGHFNLVTATLVCRLPGMPDRALDAARDKVGFVLRRLDTDGVSELAWSTTADGTKGWQPVANVKLLATGEDVAPMFPVLFKENSRQRRLLVGLIPTSSRETYQAAPTFPASVGPGDLDTRPEEFQARVTDVLRGFGPATPPTDPVQLQHWTLQRQEASMFLLLDFADFLKKNNLDFIEGSGFTGPALDLQNFLSSNEVLPGVAWLTALQFAWTNRQQVNDESLPNPYNFATSTFANSFLADLTAKVTNALGPYQPPATPSKTLLPKFDPTVVAPTDPATAPAGAHYVIRCVYQRPTCKPPHTDILSDSTEPFQLAPFYDHDAPARPIRIAMPDTSLAGLRKFAKNVAFMTSDKVRSQVSTIDKDFLKSGPTSGPGFTLGEICSFSLPIITLCAMIVLILFVILLNIVFFWLPIFRICLPIPMISKQGG
jgi:hypothetical protein